MNVLGVDGVLRRVTSGRRAQTEFDLKLYTAFRCRFEEDRLTFSWFFPGTDELCPASLSEAKEFIVPATKALIRAGWSPKIIGGKWAWFKIRYDKSLKKKSLWAKTGRTTHSADTYGMATAVAWLYMKEESKRGKAKEKK